MKELTSEQEQLARVLIRTLYVYFDTGGESHRSERARLLEGVMSLYGRGETQPFADRWLRVDELDDFIGETTIRPPRLQYRLWEPTLVNLSTFELACVMIAHLDDRVKEDEFVRNKLTTVLRSVFGADTLRTYLHERGLAEVTVEEILYEVWLRLCPY